MLEHDVEELVVGEHPIDPPRADKDRLHVRVDLFIREGLFNKHGTTADVV
jgi:hypothetical protein